MSLVEYLPGCFGDDHRFAVQPLDEMRAFELLKFCRQHQLSLDSVVTAVRDLLAARGCPPEHIEAQVVAVRRHFEPWLRG